MKLRHILLSSLAICALSVSAQTHTQGIEYYKADQFYNAEELLNRNLNNAGTDKALSYYYLGQIAMRNGNELQASKYYNDGIAANSENPYNYVGLGYIALKNNDTKTAEKYFKDAESRAKKDQSVLVEIARAYYNTDPVKYKALYDKRIEQAMKKDKDNPDIYIFQGDELRQNAYATGDSKLYGQAAAKYEMATSKDPQSAVAYVKYADMYMNAHNPNYAITKLEELIRNNPTSALGQRELANAYYENNQYDQAAEQYGKYVNNPNHFKSDEDRYAFILFADNKYNDGYNYASSLLRENPKNFTAMRFQFMNAAQLDSMQDQLLPLAENLVAAHNASPENKFAAIDYTLVADELNKAGRTDDAIAILQEAKRELPTNINFDKQLASIYIDKGDYEGASDAYGDYLAKVEKPGYNEYIQQALYAYFGGLKEGNTKYFDTARENAQKAAEASPAQYKPYKVMGDVAVATATKETAPIVAKDLYATGIELLEANPDPRFNNDAKVMYNYLGNYYLDQKNTSEAKKYFSKYLELDPDNADYRKFVDSLK